MNFSDMKWQREGEIRELEDGISIKALPETDYFVDPVSGDVVTDAVYLYQEVKGDFVLRAQVSCDFVSTYDAPVLLALEHETRWVKACFELTDLGPKAMVTVITDQRSDDANGASIEGDEVWLQLARKGDVFAIHYSLDGQDFKMARLAWLPMAETIKVGFEAQSPTGEGGWRNFRQVSLQNHSPADIRAGK